MSVVYEESKELEELGLLLIKKNHPHLASINVGYLFRSEAAVSTDPMGKTMVYLGRAVRIDDRNYVFGGRDAMIEIAKDTWEIMDDEIKTMVMDHELCHLGVKLLPDGKTPETTDQNRPAMGMIPHDIEEFEAILDRYGDSHKKLRTFMKDLNEARAAEKEAKRNAKPKGKSATTSAARQAG